jgi:hypothetical protein
MIYGHPAKKHLDNIRQSNIFNVWGNYLPTMVNMPYPCERTTQAELWELLDIQHQSSVEDQQYANFIDESLYDAWEHYSRMLGCETSAHEMEQWAHAVDPIIDYLKLYYNRPRPFQTAAYFQIPFYPTVECGSTDASYPSGHTLHSLAIAHQLTIRYPHRARQWVHMVHDVAMSRLEVGVHYPSDNLASFKIYQHISSAFC